MRIHSLVEPERVAGDEARVELKLQDLDASGPTQYVPRVVHHHRHVPHDGHVQRQRDLQQRALLSVTTHHPLIKRTKLNLKYTTIDPTSVKQPVSCSLSDIQVWHWITNLKFRFGVFICSHFFNSQ